MRHFFAVAVLATAVLGLDAYGQSDFDAPRNAPQENFRVENIVYAGGSQTPICQSVTIFHNGTVYDCMKTPSETILFERTLGRFVLLNLDRRIRTELSVGQVTAFTEELQRLALKSPDPVVKFLAEPRFQERFDPQTGELTFDGPSVSYRLQLVQQANPSTVEQYREFSDWSARVNALLTPGSRPPFGRLAVNASLAQRQAIASAVTLTFAAGKGQSRQPLTFHSEHHVARLLTPSDLDCVRETREQMSRFKFVDFVQYRKASK